MSSVEATVDDTVLMSTTVLSMEAPPTATVFAVLAVTQLTWLGALVYGAVWLLT